MFNLSEESQKADLTVRSILQIFLIIVIFGLLSYLSSILQPFVLAGLLALIFQPLVYKLSQKGIPSIVSLPLVAVITLAVIAGIGTVIADTVIEVTKEGDFLLGRLTEKLETIFVWIASTVNYKGDMRELIDNTLNDLNMESIISSAGDVAKSLSSATSNIIGNFVMFGLFFVMLLGGLKNYKDYIRFIAGNEDKGKRWLVQYEMIYGKIIRYLSTKTFTSLSTGICVFIVCLIFDVRFAAFWGFITFVLNFIPSIGSIVASAVVALFYLIQSNTIGDFVLFSLLVIFIQFFIGNILEPKMMSSRLSLNTPTVVFGLFFWGFLWGGVGMMLSVPMMVVMRIILEHIPSLSFLGRMMGSSKEMQATVIPGEKTGKMMMKRFAKRKSNTTAKQEKRPNETDEEAGKSIDSQTK